jgi:hypothetical protein
MFRGKRDGKRSYLGQGHLRPPYESNMPYPAGNSSSWSSPRTLEGARLVRLQNMASHLGFSHSPFFPKNIGQYATHLQEIHADKIRLEQEKIQLRITQLRTLDEFGKPFKLGKFLNSKVLGFRRVDAAGMKQERVWPYGITKPNEEPERKFGWPSTVEAKFDGEYRAKKGLKRQLPVPKRKVDGETAVRLMNMGMKVEIAIELLYAPEEEVGAMLKDALNYCGLDELGWKHIEADLIKAERAEQQKWRKIRQEAEYRQHGGWYVEEEVPMGGHRFDELELKKHGTWAELLKELNKN